MIKTTIFAILIVAFPVIGNAAIKTEHYILTDYQIKKFLWQHAFDHPMFNTASQLEYFKELLLDEHAEAELDPLDVYRKINQGIFNRVIKNSTGTIRLQSLNLKKFLTKRLGFCPPEAMSVQARKIRYLNNQTILRLYNNRTLEKTIRTCTPNDGSLATWLVLEQIYQACKEYISPLAFRARNKRGDPPKQIPHFFIIIKKDARGITFTTYPYVSQKNLIPNPIPLEVPKKFDWYPVAAGALTTVLTTIVAGGFCEWLILLTQAL